MKAAGWVLLSGAVSGILTGWPLTASGSPAAPRAAGLDVPAGTPRADMADAGGKHACKGQNDCKGQGGCKTEKHACKGQNACKGQGGCRTDGKKM